MKFASILVLSLLLLSRMASAEVKLNGVFSDNMVLQRDLPVLVWGTAEPEENVRAEFAGQQKTAATDASGHWRVKLDPLPASAENRTLTITADKSAGPVVVKNVLVGEVWLCGGQSNMERQLGPRGGQKPIDNWQQEQAEAKYPLIRHFQVGHQISTEPQRGLTSGKWVVCAPETVQDFTAVGYFFARDLSRVINVPIGLVHSSWGGTPAETWTPRATLETNPNLHGILDAQAKAVADYPALLEKYKAEEPARLAKYQADAQAAATAGKPAPPKPQPPRDPANTNPNAPSVLYNGMIAPLEPFAIRGVIWYQGESNGGRAKQYYPLFSSLISAWRKAWGEGEFPFLFVQLAPFRGANPELREAQLLTWLNTPNTAMAVITDSGDADDIHPPHKQAVGARLALAAEALAYGRKVQYSGPVYQAMKADGNHVELSFTNVGSGLTAQGGELKGFEVTGDDKKFVPARAVIQGNQVVVSSEQVPHPSGVRFGWAGVPEVNLFNREGLPATPFRTDAPPK